MRTLFCPWVSWKHSRKWLTTYLTSKCTKTRSIFAQWARRFLKSPSQKNLWNQMLILNQFQEILCQFITYQNYIYTLRKWKLVSKQKDSMKLTFFISLVFLACTFLKFWPTVQLHKYVSCAHTSIFLV